MWKITCVLRFFLFGDPLSKQFRLVVSRLIPFRQTRVMGCAYSYTFKLKIMLLMLLATLMMLLIVVPALVVMLLQLNRLTNTAGNTPNLHQTQLVQNFLNTCTESKILTLWKQAFLS